MGLPTILIVEDERLVASLLGQVLRSAGYQVMYASSAAEATGIGHQDQPEISILLCDVMLRDGAGADVARCVGELHPETKTIFISGYPLDMLADRGLLTPEMLQDGRTFYLQKPFRPAALVEIIDRLTEMDCGVETSGFGQTEAAHVSAAH